MQAEGRCQLVGEGLLTPDQAFQALSRASQSANKKLTAIALHLVETGELLGASAGWFPSGHPFS